MKKRSGVSIVEYALILALFAIVAVLILTSFPPIGEKETWIPRAEKEQAAMARSPQKSGKGIAPPAGEKKTSSPSGGHEEALTAPYPLVVSPAVAAPQ